MRSGAFLGVALLLAGCAGAARSSEPVEVPAWHFLRARYDRDADGRIERDEYTRSPEAFARLDADGDGVVSAADFAPDWNAVPRLRAAPDSGERWIRFQDFVHGEGGPELGEPAPEFRLATTTGETVELASFRGKKPVALVFGSYT